LTVRGAGITAIGGWSGVEVSAGAVVHVINSDFPFDPSATGIAQANGDTGLNTNAGLSSGAGPVVSNGTFWRNLYSGAVYPAAANCSSAASPAVCGSAAVGSVVVAAGATSVVVNTTAVTANSQILLTYDASLGAKLGVTCNTTEPALYGITARVAATSFTITSSSPTTNPVCFSYSLAN